MTWTISEEGDAVDRAGVVVDGGKNLAAQDRRRLGRSPSGGVGWGRGGGGALRERRERWRGSRPENGYQGGGLARVEEWGLAPLTSKEVSLAVMCPGLALFGSVVVPVFIGKYVLLQVKAQA
jgi:hypothetical protein